MAEAGLPAAEPEAGFEDFSLASPLERLVSTLEEALRGWATASPAELAAESETASGSAQLTLQKPIPYFLPTHTQSYRLQLTWMTGEEDASPAERAFPRSAHFARRVFGCTSFVLLASARRGGGMGEDEACAVGGALACAAFAAAAPWPVLLLTSSRPPQLRSCGPGGSSLPRCELRLHASHVQSSRAALALAQPLNQCALLRRRLAAAAGAESVGGEFLDGDPAEIERWAERAGAAFDVRLHFTLQSAMQSASASEAAPRRIADAFDSSSDDDDSVRAKRKGAEAAAEDTWGLITMQPGWDDCSPWSPWTSLTPPFARLSLAPCWCAIPASTLLNVTNTSHPNTGTACGGLAFNTALRWGLRAAPASATRSRGGLFPPPAGEADSDAEDWHGEAGENFGENEDEDLDDLSGALDSFSAGGGGGGGGSLAALVGRLAANALRPACAADSLAQLCSGEVWETPSWRAKHGASSLCPEAPRESVLQDRLRDVFDAPALPMALGGASPLSRHGLGRAPPTTPSRAAAAGGTPQKKVDTSAAAAASVSHAAAFELPRSCPPHSLLAQLALHCLSCGDARSVAQLWERFVRELRFSHWETGTPLPRMSDLCGGAGAVPDLGASLLHQKLQLLQICIARRAEEAGLAARDAAEALERPRGGEEAAAAAARGAREEARRAEREREAQSAAAAKAAEAKGWDDGWGSDEGEGASLRGSEEAAAQEAEVEPSLPAAAEGEPDAAAHVGPPQGVLKPLSWRLCEWPHMRAHAPRTLRPPALTEDALRERERALAASHSAAGGDGAAAAEARQKMLAAPLRSDMAAFKAANTQQGNLTLSDFVRWHSPKDWVEEEGDGGAAAAEPAAAAAAAAAAVGGSPKQPSKAALSMRRIASGGLAGGAGGGGGGSESDLPAAGPPRGRLSERMAAPDGLWAQLWASTPACAASAQKPLQDSCATGEGVLHYLELLPPAELFLQLLTCAVSAVGSTLAASPALQRSPSARQLLRSTADACALLLQGGSGGGDSFTPGEGPLAPPAYPEEWAEVSAQLRRAERVAAQAEWLHRRIGSCAPVCVEAMLARAVGGGGGGGVEVVVSEEEEVAALRRLVPGGEPPCATEHILSAVDCVAGRRQRAHTRVEGGLAVVALAVQTAGD